MHELLIMKFMRTLFKTSTLLILLSTLLVILSCGRQESPKPVIIGISKALPESSYGNYAKWIARADTGILCVDLYHMPVDSAIAVLDNCSGLLISGGPDVYPKRYGQEYDTVKCDPADFFRDTLEWSLITRAKELEMPIMGICRGLQILNIYHGGNLYPDIPTDLDTLVKHRCKDWQHCEHAVNRVPAGSLLFEICGEQKGVVNTNHHQGIERLGLGLRAVAFSEDGLIESIEYAEHDQKPFLLGVQWHPERMDTLNPFSMPIARRFVFEVRNYSREH